MRGRMRGKASRGAVVSFGEYGLQALEPCWMTSRQIVEAVDVPVFLAGGLHAGNVGDAIRAVRPYGVDLCTGVRTDDALDAAKLGKFVAAVRTA